MIKVLNILIYDQSIPTAVSQIISICLESREKRSNRCISATGSHGLVYAQKNAPFFSSLNNFFLNLPDGIPCVWVGRLKGAKNMERCYGPDFFAALMLASADKPIRHYFAGGKEGVAEELRNACGVKFDNQNIVGTYCPPFRSLTEQEFKALANDINRKKSDIVWIGLSTPKQEMFAHALSAHTNVHFIITVGAAFDFHTDRVAQAPKFIQKAGLEWFFRLCMEPKRLFRRYAEIVPFFIYYNIRELLNYMGVKKGG